MANIKSLFRISFNYCDLSFIAQSFEGGKVEILQENDEGLTIFLAYANVMGPLGCAAEAALNAARAYHGAMLELGITSVTGLDGSNY